MGISVRITYEPERQIESQRMSKKKGLSSSGKYVFGKRSRKGES